MRWVVWPGAALLGSLFVISWLLILGLPDLRGRLPTVMGAVLYLSADLATTSLTPACSRVGRKTTWSGYEPLHSGGRGAGLYWTGSMVPTAAHYSRRRFLRGGLALAGLGLLPGCGGLPFVRQQRAKVPRIGYLSAADPEDPNAEAFLDGLRELGYVEGESILIEWRFAEGRDERLPQLAAGLLAVPVDLILAAGPSATRTARDATRTLPIVMCFPGDPIGLGLIASLDRPGGNITGLASLTSELNAKRLELLAGALPGLTRVAVLWDSSAAPSLRGPLLEAGRSLGLQLDYQEVRGPELLGGALAAAIAGRAEALFVADSPLFTAHRQQIAGFAMGNRLPTSGAGRAFAEAGALLSYGARLPDMYRRAASGVDKILKGADPAELPVERPTTFDLVINLKIARALGLTIPQAVLQQATEVIQ